ncbi:glycoside hydrolase family protein [Formosa sp. PL04]|uniref:glycoside hydrolase family protein n=1 Tax=Formosa sp. PL04 TaxID=3081755 RepID=UPI002980DBE6|nr:glycoside hydrolase family protein [Formosa sp. PL04]MDW5290141.1 glycoside hydrolase family protein [Formosa sp. PL04]
MLINLVFIFSCKQEPLSIKESSFVKSLETGKYILPAEDSWWNWCMAPIYDEQGKLHVFMSTIPKQGSWITDSKIVHFTANSPEGPYTFVDTTFASNNATYHNPQISKVKDTYVLVYLWKPSNTPNFNQSIGIATAKSLNGPWVESPNNPIIKPSHIPGTPNARHASNPTFVADKDGKYRIYYKSISDKKPYLRTISLAIADHIEGPYENYEKNPLISYEDLGLDIEDPYAFLYQDKYYMIVEDRMGIKDALEGNQIPDSLIKRGGNRPGLIYKSDDGITWERPEIGYQTNSYYFNEELSRTERPHILWKDGEPEALFLANHDSNEAGFFLKIKDWKAE